MPNRNVVVGLLIAGAFIAILNQTLLVTALPHIMADFNIDATKAQWLTTAFMLTNGILIPITAFLIEELLEPRAHHRGDEHLCGGNSRRCGGA